MITDNKTTVITVVGPTASGKTSLAVALSKRYNGEVISADSMQIYKGMSIGTAKPTESEKDGIVHHLIDFVEPTNEFSLGDYLSIAHETIAEIKNRGKVPIIAGGTGLYVSSLINDVKLEQTKPSTQLRDEITSFANKFGVEKLFQMLVDIDPIAAEKIHPNNVPRVIRAIEAFKLTGISIVEHQKNSIVMPSRYNCLKIGINFKDREVLYDRINRRVDMMIDNGLLEEAFDIFESKYLKTALQAIGYKELFPYFNKEITLQEAVANLKQSSRRYAKRQLTWFRRDDDINWFYADEFENIQIMQKNIYNTVDNFIKTCYD